MDWFEVVVYVWEGVFYDYVYGVVEVVLVYFVFDVDVDDFFGEFCY